MDVPNLPQDEPEAPARAPMTLRSKLVIALGLIALLLIVVLHLTGVIGESRMGH